MKSILLVLFVVCRLSMVGFAQQITQEQQIIQLSKKKFEWYQNYLRDSFLLKYSSIKDIDLEFSK